MRNVAGDPEIVRLCRVGRSPSTGPHLGVDSPTQLRLLGNNLMEGLLGDSPRSQGDEMERERRIDALNLLSPPTNGSVSDVAANLLQLVTSLISEIAVFLVAEIIFNCLSAATVLKLFVRQKFSS